MVVNIPPKFPTGADYNPDIPVWVLIALALSGAVFGFAVGWYFAG